jgi:type II secretion system protein D
MKITTMNMNKLHFRGILFTLAAAAAFLAAVPQLLAQAPGGQTQNRPATTGATGAARPATGGGGGSGGTSSGGRQYSDATMMGTAMIQEDPESRSLVVVTDDDTEKEIMKVITSLDRPKPQVMIKVVFAEVSLNKNLEMGVEGSYTFNVASPANLTGTSTTTTNSTATTAGGNSVTSTGLTSSPANALNPGQLGTGSAQSIFGLSQLAQGSFVRLATDNWQATLYALASHGVVNVLSRPTIMARNNQQAVIVVGQEVPLVTNSQISALGNTTNTVQYQDVGVILRVTPFISTDKTVEMIVAPEISSLDSQSVTLSPGVSSPIIDKRAAETVVVTPDTKTIVIGGLMQKQLTSTIQKIPILGDIPWAGALFRHTIKNETKSELLIFLTPYIIEGTDKLDAITQDEVNRTDLPDRKASFSQKDLDDYLDNLKIKPREPTKDELPKKGDPDILMQKLQEQN